ncbi:rolling circle replication-associated protein [Bradyrhizobium sp. 27S5]|uniref:rolling circle replication-associated protein n=1 Tax=Bradyrhizobium sp. 27S5 TaxID=3139728 RepID=UPI0030D5DAE9
MAGCIAVSTREWLALFAADFHDPIFVTLVLKERMVSPVGGVILQSPEIARSEIKRFTNRIDRTIYGPGVQRYQLRVRRIPVLEYGVDRGWHCHMLIERPERVLEVRFRHIIRSEWSKSPWAAGFHTRGANSAAVDYLTKERSKAKLEAWSDTLIVEAMVLDTK